MCLFSGTSPFLIRATVFHWVHRSTRCPAPDVAPWDMTCSVPGRGLVHVVPQDLGSSPPGGVPQSEMLKNNRKGGCGDGRGV